MNSFNKALSSICTLLGAGVPSLLTFKFLTSFQKNTKEQNDFQLEDIDVNIEETTIEPVQPQAEEQVREQTQQQSSQTQNSKENSPQSGPGGGTSELGSSSGGNESAGDKGPSLEPSSGEDDKEGGSSEEKEPGEQEEGEKDDTSEDPHNSEEETDVEEPEAKTEESEEITQPQASQDSELSTNHTDSDKGIESLDSSGKSELQEDIGTSTEGGANQVEHNLASFIIKEEVQKSISDTLEEFVKTISN